MSDEEILAVLLELVELSSKRAELLGMGEFDYYLDPTPGRLIRCSDVDLKESVDFYSERIKNIADSLLLEDLKKVAVVVSVGIEFLHYAHPDEYYEKYPGMELLRMKLKKLNRYRKLKTIGWGTSKNEEDYRSIVTFFYWLHEYITAALEQFNS